MIKVRLIEQASHGGDVFLNHKVDDLLDAAVVHDFVVNFDILLFQDFVLVSVPSVQLCQHAVELIVQVLSPKLDVGSILFKELNVEFVVLLDSHTILCGAPTSSD